MHAIHYTLIQVPPAPSSASSRQLVSVIQSSSHHVRSLPASLSPSRTKLFLGRHSSLVSHTLPPMRVCLVSFVPVREASQVVYVKCEYALYLSRELYGASFDCVIRCPPLTVCSHVSPRPARRW
jgi:hypothetical protein